MAESNLEHLTRNHPCFSKEAHFKHGRIHLPVSPTCNIQCKFCKRSFNKSEIRPGVTNSILSPKKAVEILDKALELCPEIIVAGIAGPGDTLASEYAITTFELIHKKHPDLINCMSTNGLLLQNYVERIAKSGVKTLTVTVNAVNPNILEKICSGIMYHGNYYTGKEATRILISAQLLGIKKAVELGLTVKINAVIIPNINDHHIGEIARVTSKLGALIMNIIPLIPQGEFENLEPPTCEQLNEAREDAEKYISVFRHCKHCRADACGIPGKGNDISDLLYEVRGEDTFSHG